MPTIRKTSHILPLLIVFLCFVSPSAWAADPIGQVVPVTLSAGAASVSLDFTDREYELLLVATAPGDPDTARTFAYQARLGEASPKLASAGPPAVEATLTPRDRLEAQLRRRERELAAALRAQGGWRPSLQRPTALYQEAQSRTFAFEAYGNVTSDRTVTATLVASNDRAIGYLDDALPPSPDNIAEADIQAILDRFATANYGLVTSTFGQPSDVDGNGKVIFLFTHLVDEVGGVAGFYASGSLFTTDIGGDGNLADMMYISPTRPLATYESLLAHEFQHLINFYQHAMARDGEAEETWVNEALSHYTEDLVGGHVSGGNADLVATYLENPGLYTLTSDVSPLYGGNRGAAYLFLRGLVDAFGPDVASGLVQTNRVGVPNVEAATGMTFRELLETFGTRLFLSGTGASSASAYNYTYRYLTEPRTGYRSMPLPAESTLSLDGAVADGAVKPASPAYVRLSGAGQAVALDIQTDVDGDFTALLVPLERPFVPDLALPVDYFQGLTLDNPFPGVFRSGEAVTISGASADPTVSRLLLRFTPLSGSGDAIRAEADVAGGRFSRGLIFASAQAGTYLLDVFAGVAGESLPGVGSFSGLIVLEGEGPVSLPADYIAGLTFDAALPTEYQAGQPGSFAGSVSGSGLEVLLFVFTSQSGGAEIRVQTDVFDDRFRKGFVFQPEEAGTYDLSVYGGPSGGQLPYLGGFTPITVAGTGSERVWLPVDAFDKVLLDEPVLTTFYAGAPAALAGQVTDPAVTQIAVSFTPDAGGESVDSFWDVTDGRFQAEVSFGPSQTGTYELTLYGGVSGGQLPYLGDFTPIHVVSSRPSAAVSAGPLTWPALETGTSESRSVVVGNYGSEALAVTASVAAGPFTAQPGSLAVSPGDSAAVTVTFAPTTAGAFNDILTLATNDPDRPEITVGLSASATSGEAPDGAPTDFNGDGITNFADFIAFARVYGTTSADAGYDAIYDLNADGRVGFQDFIAFARAYGS